jgi:hypothetical protein
LVQAEKPGAKHPRTGLERRVQLLALRDLRERLRPQLLVGFSRAYKQGVEGRGTEDVRVNPKLHVGLPNQRLERAQGLLIFAAQIETGTSDVTP